MLPNTPVASPRPPKSGAPPVYRPMIAVNAKPGVKPQASSRPVPPPVYRPQAAVPQMKPASMVAPAVHRTPAVTPRLASGQQVIQAVRACGVCGHKHGSVRCRCGCTSHSGHWRDPGRFNPGAGRRARMLAARAAPAAAAAAAAPAPAPAAAAPAPAPVVLTGLAAMGF